MGETGGFLDPNVQVSVENRTWTKLMVVMASSEFTNVDVRPTSREETLTLNLRINWREGWCRCVIKTEKRLDKRYPIGYVLKVVCFGLGC